MAKAFKETEVGKFLQSKGFNTILSAVGSMVPVVGVLKNVKDAVMGSPEYAALSPEDQAKFLELHKIDLEYAQKEYEAQLKDVQDARGLYKTNSGLQKIYAVTFLASYILLIPTMIFVYINYSDKMNVITGTFLGSLFTGMSLKVEGICTFLFGSTEASRKKDDTIANLTK